LYFGTQKQWCTTANKSKPSQYGVRLYFHVFQGLSVDEKSTFLETLYFNRASGCVIRVYLVYCVRQHLGDFIKCKILFFHIKNEIRMLPVLIKCMNGG